MGTAWGSTNFTTAYDSTAIDTAMLQGKYFEMEIQNTSGTPKNIKLLDNLTLSRSISPAPVGPNYMAVIFKPDTDWIAGGILSATIGTMAAGTGYTVAPTVTVTDGTGSGAVVTANISGGAVTGFTIVNGGMNYSSPVFVLSGGDGTGAGATGAASITLGIGGYGMIGDIVDLTSLNPIGNVAGATTDSTNSINKYLNTVGLQVPAQVGMVTGKLWIRFVPYSSTAGGTLGFVNTSNGTVTTDMSFYI